MFYKDMRVIVFCMLTLTTILPPIESFSQDVNDGAQVQPYTDNP